MQRAKVQPCQIASPARCIYLPARFHNAAVERIDLAAETARTYPETKPSALGRNFLDERQ